MRQCRKPLSNFRHCRYIDTSFLAIPFHFNYFRLEDGLPYRRQEYREMLRITWKESADSIHIQLAGKLAGPWVREFAAVWKQIEPLCQGRPAEVSLQDVTFVDDAGEQLLTAIHRAGVRLTASRPLTGEIVRGCTRTEQGLTKCLL